DMNKSEIRSTKYETSSNDQNPNDQNNNRTCTFQVSSFLSFENSNLNCFVSNFDIRDSDFQAMISHRINRTHPDAPQRGRGLVGFFSASCIQQSCVEAVARQY
ncbi:MAG: hypothetical protein CVU57_31285, partial [Deltaproteobacteria bacterium HGW-Deltaproteobacteria-15]